MTGLVKEKETGRPVPGVTVHQSTKEGSGWNSVTTDSEGRYRTRILAGRFDVRVNPTNAEKWFTDDFGKPKGDKYTWCVQPGDRQPLKSVRIDAVNSVGRPIVSGQCFSQSDGIFQMRVRESTVVSSYQARFLNPLANGPTVPLQVDQETPLILREVVNAKPKPSSVNPD